MWAPWNAVVPRLLTSLPGIAAGFCFKASQEYPSTAIYASLHPSCAEQFLPQLPGAGEAQLSGFKVNEVQLDRQKWCFPCERTPIHNFREILGLFQPKYECGSVRTACREWARRGFEGVDWLSDKQAEKPFTPECLCSCGHQDGFAGIHSAVLFQASKWWGNPLFYQSMRVVWVSRTLVPRITGTALSIIVSPLRTGRRSRWQINQLQWPAVLQTCGLSAMRGEAQTDAADPSYLPAVPQPCKGEAWTHEQIYVSSLYFGSGLRCFRINIFI